MTTRDIRIDVLRGIAMVTILLNHFGDHAKYFFGFEGYLIPTPTKIGYSSAASLFVALSGYMVGMVYLRGDAPMRTATQRAFKIYFINLLALALVVPMVLLADTERDYFLIAPLLQEPAPAFLRFLTFQYAPIFLDVLQLYVMLLLLAPVAILLLRRSPWLLAACSILLWAVMQIAPPLLFGPSVFTAEGPPFNVLAWQAAFFLPMLAGRARLHERLFDGLRQRPGVFLAILVALGLFAVARLLHLEQKLPFADLLTNRRFHSPVWTLHAALMLCAYAGMLAWLTPYMDRLPFRMLALLGRNSLNVFAASIPLTYALLLAFDALEPGYAGYWIGVAILLGLSWANAAWSDRRRAQRKGERTAQPAPARAGRPQPA